MNRTCLLGITGPVFSWLACSDYQAAISFVAMLDPWHCKTRLRCLWWRYQMRRFSALLALCERKPPVTGGFPSQRPVTRSFDVFFHLCLNKRLSKQSRCWWFETPWRSLWRHCNAKQFVRAERHTKPLQVASGWLFHSIHIKRHCGHDTTLLLLSVRSRDANTCMRFWTGW